MALKREKIRLRHVEIITETNTTWRIVVHISVCVCVFFSRWFVQYNSKVHQIDNVCAWKTIKHWTIERSTNVNTDVQTYRTRCSAHVCGYVVSWNLVFVCWLVFFFRLFSFGLAEFDTQSSRIECVNDRNRLRWN